MESCVVYREIVYSQLSEDELNNYSGRAPVRLVEEGIV
jgi:hypothetical protein